MIIEEASKVTAERGSRKVEAYHLYVSASPLCLVLASRLVFFGRKHAVETVDMLDFLKEIVEGVPDPSAGGTIDLEAEQAEKDKKKRGKGKKSEATLNLGGTSGPSRRRKRKVEKEKDGDDMEVEPEDEDGAGASARAQLEVLPPSNIPSELSLTDNHINLQNCPILMSDDDDYQLVEA